MKTNVSMAKGRGSLAFTLSEIMVAMAIFTMVGGMVLYAHVCGLKMYQMLYCKLGASEDAKSAINRLVNEIQSSYDFDVGPGNSNSFAMPAIGTPQQGNALQIYFFATNTGTGTVAVVTNQNFIRYYHITNPASADYGKVFRFINVSNSTRTTVIANKVTNSPIFFFEDFRSTTTNQILTEPTRKMVLGVDLVFYQMQYPVVTLGSNSLFDYYRLRTKITRRTH